MFGPTGSVSVALGSIVLDRPDQTGVYVAKDLVGGWAYLVTDHEGDGRLRGHGACAGGLEVALRCALLSAASRVPYATQLRIVVDTAQAHRAMVRLATTDQRVVAAIAGRPVAVMTRPQERSSFHVRAAAERAAAAALLDREQAEQSQDALDALPPEALAPQAATPEALTPQAATPEILPPSSATDATPGAAASWRLRRGAETARPPLAKPARVVPQPASGPFAGVQRLMRPLVDGARSGLVAAGVLGASRVAPRSRAVSDWLSEFETCVETVRADLRDVET